MYYARNHNYFSPARSGSNTAMVQLDELDYQLAMPLRMFNELLNHPTRLIIKGIILKD